MCCTAASQLRNLHCMIVLHVTAALISSYKLIQHVFIYLFSKLLKVSVAWECVKCYLSPSVSDSNMVAAVVVVGVPCES